MFKRKFNLFCRFTLETFFEVQNVAESHSALEKHTNINAKKRKENANKRTKNYDANFDKTSQNLKCILIRVFNDKFFFTKRILCRVRKRVFNP